LDRSKCALQNEKSSRLWEKFEEIAGFIDANCDFALAACGAPKNSFGIGADHRNGY
jgi:hypothetical protein